LVPRWFSNSSRYKSDSTLTHSFVCTDWPLFLPNSQIGYADSSIRKWEVDSLKCVLTIDNELATNKDRALIWQLELFQDGTIVSGDSKGWIKFWESKFGSILYEKQHTGDILALKVTKDENVVFASGADSQILGYRRIRSQNTNDGEGMQVDENEIVQWVQFTKTRGQSHDVKALCFNERNKQLISGGVTTDICVYHTKNGSFTDVFSVKGKRKLRHVTCFPSKPIISVSPDQKLILMHHETMLHLWKYEEGESPSKLAEIDTAGSNIVCSEISESGKWVAYSSAEATRLYQFDYKEMNLTKLEIELPPSRLMKFTHNSRKLITAEASGITHIYDLASETEETVDLRQVNQFRGDNFQDPGYDIIVSLDISYNNSFIALGTLANEISVWSIKSSSEIENLCTLPNFGDNFHTVIKFMPNNTVLAVAHEDNRFYFYDFQVKQMRKWSRKYMDRLPANHLERYNNIIGIEFSHLYPSRVLLYTNYYTISVNLREAPPKEALVERVDVDRTDWFKILNQRSRKVALEHDDDITFKISYKFTNILAIKILRTSEMLVVENPWDEILKTLPHAVKSKRYGKA